MVYNLARIFAIFRVIRNQIWPLGCHHGILFSLDFIRILLDHRRHSSSTNSKMIRNLTWLLGRHLRSIFQIYNTRNIEAIDLNFAQIIINVILIQISVQLKSKTADKDFSFLIISLRNIGAIDFIRCS